MNYLLQRLLSAIPVLLGITIIVFFIISTYPLVNNGEIRLWFLIISLIFLILGLMNSKILMPLNKIWFKFGIFLGNFIAPIVMGAIYFFVVTPTGLIMKMLGKDLLNLKKSNKDSYEKLIDKLGIRK